MRNDRIFCNRLDSTPTQQNVVPCLLLFFYDLHFAFAFSLATYTTLITGRHKWEMNNTYEHTTPARNSRNGWKRITRTLEHLDFPREFWDMDNLGFFTNIFEDIDPRLLFFFFLYLGIDDNRHRVWIASPRKRSIIDLLNLLEYILFST